MLRRWMAVGSILALLGVMLGAFGAHMLRSQFAPSDMETFKTGSHYHLIHALAMVCAAGFARPGPGERWMKAACWAFLIGIIAFSGALYALAITGQRILGAVAPIGGLSFMIGWGLLAWVATRPEA